MDRQIFIEDHVVPLLFTSAIEAYEIGDAKPRNNTDSGGLETYGLLWGYSLPAREETEQAERIVAVTATIETSALRKRGSTTPAAESIRIKRDFVRQYWPQLELVGTFHSHPYGSLSEVQSLQGWRASDGDMAHWPYFHDEFCPEIPSLAHLIVTICSLEKRGSAWPSRLSGSEESTGYVLSADHRKLWIKAYATNRVEPVNSETSSSVVKDVVLDIPSLQNRFMR